MLDCISPNAFICNIIIRARSHCTIQSVNDVRSGSVIAWFFDLNTSASRPFDSTHNLGLLAVELFILCTTLIQSGGIIEDIEAGYLEVASYSIGVTGAGLTDVKEYSMPVQAECAPHQCPLNQTNSQ